MTLRHRALAVCVGVVVIGAGGLLAQEPGGAPRVERSVRRVPPFFAQVGLSTQQREAIYGIRGKYAGRVDELKRQIEQLQQQELAECETVLNPAQRAQIAQRRATQGRSRTQANAKEAESGN